MIDQGEIDEKDDGAADAGIFDRLRREADELKLQLYLEKAEAEDYIEKHKGDFSGFLGKVRKKLEQGGGLGEEKAKAVRRKVDELRVQLALGKMETRDAYEAQREKIGEAVASLKEEMEPLAEKADGIWKSLKAQVESGGEALKTKFDALRLQMGLATAELGEEAKLKRDQIGEELRDISIKLQEAGSAAKDKMEVWGGDIAEAFTGLKARLKDLF